MYINSGIALLNAKKPDWLKSIRSQALNFESDSECVLGQVFGSYAAGLSQLSIGLLQAAEYGFDLRADFKTRCESYSYLRRLWKDKIHLLKARQAAG
jgi:hypothetical protein